METDKLANWINDNMLEGIRQFGEYTFYDKGPEEIMDMDKCNSMLRNCSPSDAMETLKKLENIIDEKYCQDMLECIVCSNDSWDEFWETDTEFCEKYT